MSVKEGTISVRNSVMNYVVFGKGDKPMLLIPGLTLKDVKGSGIGLAYMYRLFSQKYRVYCIDKKMDLPLDYTIYDIAEDYAAAIRELGINKAYVLGVSQGGMIAQYLALNHPEMVQKAVLAVTLSRNNDTVVTAINHWVQLAEDKRYEELVKDTFEKNYSEAYVKKYRWLFPILAKISKPKNLERFISLAKACLTCNSYETLDEIQCPVLVIGGKKDLIVSGNASNEMAEKIGCNIYMYEELGHSAYDEGKDFNQRVYEFFDE